VNDALLESQVHGCFDSVVKLVAGVPPDPVLVRDAVVTYISHELEKVYAINPRA
jgi:hypothetical protein